MACKILGGEECHRIIMCVFVTIVEDLSEDQMLTSSSRMVRVL